jgi:uncharacterized protein YwqG
MDPSPSDADRLIDATLPPDAADRLRATMRPAIALRAVPSSGRTRLGGRPLLPPSTPWPMSDDRPLSSLAMIDLAEVADHAAGIGLPAAGLLNVFYDVDEQPWGFDPGDGDGHRVLLADPHTAVETEPPAGATAFPTAGLDATRVATYPGWEEDVTDWITGPDADSGPDMRYADLIQRLEADIPAGRDHRLGGWPALIQAPWQRECQLASNGFSGSAQGPEVDALESGVDEWVQLLQLDSDDDLGWMWGDVGMLYIAIRRQDLAASAFDRTWLVLQCT